MFRAAEAVAAPDYTCYYLAMSRPDTLAHYLLRSVNKAQRHYRLFDTDDRVLVAVSGGKDSLTLLDLLHRRRVSGPETLHLVAGHIQTDYHCGRAVSTDWLVTWCAERDIPLLRTNISVAEVVTTSTHSQCFWCARARRKALFELARKADCAKLAFGHHADDVAETTLMNLFYNGRVEAMQARSVLFDGSLTVVRPLALVEERDISTFARASGYPIEGVPCPQGARSRRALMKRILRDAEIDRHDIKRSIYNAVDRIEQSRHNASGQSANQAG